MADLLQDQLDYIAGESGDSEGISGNQPEEITNKDVSDSIARIVDIIDQEERPTRDLMLRLWKYMDLLWSGAGNYYWDHGTGFWRSITQEDIATLARTNEIDPSLLNKTVNLIRPYGESLIGVLTTGMPKVVFFPEDADEPLDILASKAYSNIEQKISDDNMLVIRLMEIFVNLWNGGFSAAYNYEHSDARYGIYREPITGEKNYSQEILTCTICGNETPGPEEEELGAENLEASTDESAPGTDISDDETLAEPEPNPEAIEPPIPIVNNYCEQCGGETSHVTSRTQFTREEVIGQLEIPKKRQLINIYGPLNVKIPASATRKEHIIWTILEEELDVALVKYTYPAHKDKIVAATSSNIDIDRAARTDPEISDDTYKFQTTLRKVWLKPASYEKLNDQAKIDTLLAKYPDGVKAIFSGNNFLEAEGEKLDDHWTFSKNPLYKRIYGDPLGKGLIGLHETANDLFQLEVDTVRFSIPETYADPAHFDFKAYEQSRKSPGGISPLKRPAGGSLSDVMYETKTATIPKEVENLDLKVEKLLQFISGVLPSVFGGPATGSKTLGEYEQSKNQALQRLSIPWKVVLVMYAELMAKACKAYKEGLFEDEKFVQRKGSSFLNVWIRKSDLMGKIGEVRPEVSEQFPATWGQISGRVMELLGMNNAMITSFLLHPENVELLYKVLGVEDLYIPGEEQRNKQLFEISQLIITPPSAGLDPMSGMEMPTSSVPIEPIDDDAVHMQVTAAFLASEIGQDLKMTNPMGYQNCMLHYQEHSTRYQQAIMAQQQQEAQAEGGENGQSEQVQ